MFKLSRNSSVLDGSHLAPCVHCLFHAQKIQFQMEKQKPGVMVVSVLSGFLVSVVCFQNESDVTENAHVYGWESGLLFPPVDLWPWGRRTCK